MRAVRSLAHVCVKSTHLLDAGIILDVLTALRQATAQRHAVLDTRTPLAAEAPDLRAYHDHLRLLEAWLAPIHDRLDDDGAAKRHLDLIRADLAHPALGDMPDRVHEEGAPWPPNASAAYRWGVSYVNEGSPLGRAGLYKGVAPGLGPPPAT